MMLSRRRSRIHLVRDVIQDHTSQLSSRSLAKIFNHQAQELLEVPNSVSKSGGDQLFLRLSFLCTHQLLLAILASGNSTLLAVVTCWQVCCT